MKATKKSLWLSAVSMMLCVVMLLGITFAWFTDSVTNKDNVIQAGNLEVQFDYRGLMETTAEDYKKVDSKALFNDVKWEPGKSFGYDFKVTNAGSLAFDWELSFQNIKSEGGTNNVNIADVLDVYVIENVAVNNLDGVTPAKLSALNNGVVTSGQLKAEDRNNTQEFSVVIKMKEDANNDYQGAKVTFDIYLRAKQATVEKDGFESSDYDKDATYDKVVVSPSKPEDITLKDGDVLDLCALTDTEGTVDEQFEITVAEGASVEIIGDPNVTYDGAQIVLSGNNKVTVKDITIKETKATGFSYRSAMEVHGTDNTLILEGNNVFDARGDYNSSYEMYTSAGAGIRVPQGSELTISGTGEVKAYGASWAAGIGDKAYGCAGIITIESGTVYAYGGSMAAGIGGGQDSAREENNRGADSTVGSVDTPSSQRITINGGTVYAYGGSTAAGIGTGGDVYNDCNVGIITINAGTVYAEGGSQGAGIGIGQANAYFHQGGKGGQIIISGGTVTAIGKDGAAGIGGGGYHSRDTEKRGSHSGDITIGAEASVTATPGAECGNAIGAGLNGEDGKIVIEQ